MLLVHWYGKAENAGQELKDCSTVILIRTVLDSISVIKCHVNDRSKSYGLADAFTSDSSYY